MTTRFVGVDVSERRGLDVVVLGGDRTVTGPPHARVSPGELETLLGEQEPVAVAIDSPPEWARSGRSRQGEQELARLGISCYRTPSEPDRIRRPFYNWMRVGHDTFAAAARAGYPLYRGGPTVAGHALEVFPHAAAVALAGARPPPGTARDARRKATWRRGVLEAAGVDTTALHGLDQIDAALAALTAIFAAEGHSFALGHPDEGLLVLPGDRPPGPWPRPGPRPGV